jgi:hypothetical protein
MLTFLTEKLNFCKSFTEKLSGKKNSVVTKASFG